MREYNIHVSRMTDQAQLVTEIRKVLPPGEFALIGWWDQGRKTGGPIEACADQPEECVRRYAVSHGAEFEVSVNDRALELFYVGTPPGTEKLDWHELIEIHRGADRDDSFDNVQGG
jgi:hypothetical protein